MSDKLTDEQIAAIRAGCEGVTPGPWHLGSGGHKRPDECHALVMTDKAETIVDTLNGCLIEANDDGDEEGAYWVDAVGMRNAAHIARCDPDTIRALTTEVLELRAREANRRICVNCGKYAPEGHDRAKPLDECVDERGYSACTFDMTPDEAWQYWRQKAHDTQARLTAAEREMAVSADSRAEAAEARIAKLAAALAEIVALSSDRSAVDRATAALEDRT